MTETSIQPAPSLTRSLLLAATVVFGLAVGLGLLWHRADVTALGASTPTAVASHGPAWR